MEVLESVLIFVTSLVFTFASALIDIEHLDKGHYIDSHSSRFIQRATFFTLIGLYNYELAIAGVLLFAAIFDQMINYGRDMDLFYLGTVAKWDRFWRKYKSLYISFKIIALGLSILLFLP
jgi:hypothetical protein